MRQTIQNLHNFSHIFNNTTNSYKFTFFLGILELLKIKEFKSRTLDYEELGSMMAAIAWVPTFYFKLNLGARDQTKLILGKITIESKGISLYKIYRYIYLDKSIKKYDLLEYVPHRLIRPFFSNELRGVKDALVNKSIERLSQEPLNSHLTSLYEIDDKNKQIKLNTEWLIYLQNNYPIIKSWAENNWCQYLQKQNPNSPGIINKITLDFDRSNLSRQRDFWLSALEKINVRCIYTNEKIKKNFHLDHFLPWRFVAHNQLWNLIPTSPEINLNKSDSIPDQKFIRPMAQTQFKLLEFTKSNLLNNKWQSLANEYFDGIGLEDTQCMNELTIENAYQKTYLPLFQIAINSGFNHGWKI